MSRNQIKLEVVTASDPAEFQRLFNSKMDELKQFDPHFEFNNSQGFCAYITYLYSEKINGIVETSCDGTCGTCISAEKPQSDKVKWVKCPIFGAVNKNKSACEHYSPEVSYGN